MQHLSIIHDATIPTWVKMRVHTHSSTSTTTTTTTATATTTTATTTTAAAAAAAASAAAATTTGDDGCSNNSSNRIKSQAYQTHFSRLIQQEKATQFRHRPKHSE